MLLALHELQLCCQCAVEFTQLILQTISFLGSLKVAHALILTFVVLQSFLVNVEELDS